MLTCIPMRIQDGNEYKKSKIICLFWKIWFDFSYAGNIFIVTLFDVMYLKWIK